MMTRMKCTALVAKLDLKFHLQIEVYMIMVMHKYLQVVQQQLKRRLMVLLKQIQE